MISFPNCKINLGLRIVGKRADGFHNIETVFYQLAINDVLEVINEHDTNDPEKSVVFSSGGLSISGKDTDNLCVKAYNLLKSSNPAIPSIRIHLHKAIPMGAGLGGGSADGAYTLLALNQKYELGLTTAQLINYALQLGSDCPFFILNKPSIGRGRGELLDALKIDLSTFQLVLVNPGIHVNTGWAFTQLAEASYPKQGNFYKTIQDIIAQPIETWKDELGNDFEIPVFSKFKEVREIKEILYANGAVYAAMSGSGSSVYGLFYNNVKPYIDFPSHYLCKKLFL